MGELTDLGLPTVGSVGAEPAHHLVEWGRTWSLSVFDLGLACCAVEFAAAASRRPDLFPPLPAPGPPTPKRVEVMVVSGTVTDMMAPSVLRAYERMTEPKAVLSFGSCANSGGPYWDSYCVTKGVDQILPVDVYVPGCPPRPESLAAGLRLLHELLESGS